MKGDGDDGENDDDEDNILYRRLCIYSYLVISIIQISIYIFFTNKYNSL